MLAGMVMHFFEDVLGGFVQNSVEKMQSAPTLAITTEAIAAESVQMVPSEQVIAVGQVDVVGSEVGQNNASPGASSIVSPRAESSALIPINNTNATATTIHVPAVVQESSKHDVSQGLDDTSKGSAGGGTLASLMHVHAGHTHSHAGTDITHVSKAGPGDVRFIVAAMLMEFGVSVHSIFIGMQRSKVSMTEVYHQTPSQHGALYTLQCFLVFIHTAGLAVGVLSDADLTALLVALCFHQVCIVNLCATEAPA